MVSIFHGSDAETHDAFQNWRQEHADGFDMPERPKGMFTIHYAQDKRENDRARGCNHQGGSGNGFRVDKGGCYTTARKVCSDSLAELLEWASDHRVDTKSCAHCDTRKFPFPNVAATER